MTRMITVVPRENNFLYSSFEVRTKESIEYRLAQFGGVYTCGSKRGQSYSGRVKDGFIFLFIAEKFRRKAAHSIVPHGHRAKNRVTIKESTPLRDSHWKVRVYKFPLDRVISAKQLTRTFEISISG